MLGCTASGTNEQTIPTPPNVLFITVDDMNGWGVKDHYPQVKMPHFEKLRSESVNFTKAVCPAPVCVPSRAAFFSGIAAYTPLLIRLPDGQKMELPHTVNLLDIYPTLIDYCRLDPPQHQLDGESLLPLIEDPEQERAPSFMTYGEDYSSVHDGRYRYIRYPDGSEELYDHTVDPHEWNNLADAGYRKIMDRLAKSIPEAFAEMMGGRTEAQQKVKGLPKDVGGT